MRKFFFLLLCFAAATVFGCSSTTDDAWSLATDIEKRNAIEKVFLGPKAPIKCSLIGHDDQKIIQGIVFQSPSWIVGTKYIDSIEDRKTMDVVRKCSSIGSDKLQFTKSYKLSDPQKEFLVTSIFDFRQSTGEYPISIEYPMNLFEERKQSESWFVSVNGDYRTIKACCIACEETLKRSNWKDCQIVYFKNEKQGFEIWVAIKPFAYGSVRYLKISDDGELVSFETGP